MDHIFTCLTHWLAPVLSFTAEEAWLSRYGENTQNTHQSIHLQAFPDIPLEWGNAPLAEQWETIRDARRVMTGALEGKRAAKTIGSSLQAHVTVYVSHAVAEVFKAVGINDSEMAELSITSKAHLVIGEPPVGAFTIEDIKGIGVVVMSAPGQKCNRCWKVLEEVGQAQADLCNRCANVARGWDHG
jgi:isoleucyl-tRNA synthetase